MNSDPYRTYHSHQALELSEIINLQFGRIRYGTAEPRTIRMKEPDGPSTDSGRKARQPLLLVRPDEAQNGPGNPFEPTDSGVVFGFVDLFKRTADLRSYSTLCQKHEERFGTPFGMSRTEYARLLEEIKTFLESQAIDARVLSAAQEGPPIRRTIHSTARSPSATSAFDNGLATTIASLLLAFAIGFSLCYLLFVLRVLPV